jgi:hypothetical protein
MQSVVQRMTIGEIWRTGKQAIYKSFNFNLKFKFKFKWGAFHTRDDRRIGTAGDSESGSALNKSTCQCH